MIGEVIVIGDLQLRDGASVDEHDRLGARMYDIVSRLPGFVSVKSFKADDGEELTVFRLPRRKRSKPGAPIPNMSRR
ncbi:hypothetical protein ABIB75_003915 [Bradyrhizobium sp. GM2.2]|uniref:hypothetical protein n=1 Tax=Bradyrhizobium sp. GM2.2 TaxID=3156358 RepID=UPI0033920C4C